MSRTKRIYNTAHWQWHADGHIVWYPNYSTATYMDTGKVSMIAGFESKIVHITVNDWYPSYFGTFFYHPYDQVCMGCCVWCSIQRTREKRTRRRKLKLEEHHYIKHWKDEIDDPYDYDTPNCIEEEN